MWIYSFLFYLLTPFLLLRLWYKGFKIPAYRERIGQRFGFYPQAQEVEIWIHAVSLGEVIAASPLIEALLKQGRSILVTTTTPTGAAKVSAQFKDRVRHCYLPYELPWGLKRFFRAYKPKLGLIMETELWPNLIDRAKRAGLKLFLVNARLSPHSFQRYEKFSWFFRSVLNQFTAILAQDKADASRFCGLGADQARVEVLGNIKFDLEPKGLDLSLFQGLKKAWGESRLTVIAASTHEGEEALILQAFPEFKRRFKEAILLIAPRHPERFTTVFKLAQDLGFATGLRTQVQGLDPSKDVVVLDSIGELLGFYKISDYAFVGGSLVPIGGHNVLEPIAMGTPVFTGPQVFNFKAISEGLIQVGGLEFITTGEELFEKISQLEADKPKREAQIKHATQILNSNKGALARVLARIEA